MAHELPEHWSISHEVNGNVARRLVTPSSEFNLSTSEEKLWAETSDSRWRVLHPGEQRREEGIALQARSPIRAGKSIKAKDLTWLGTPSLISSREVLRSYQGAFSFRIEDPDAGRTGLRQPQVGAVYALLGYWTTRRFEPATVVMPTGTGKTETMLALLVAAQIERLLVVVPSDALREQLASKFETLGKLREFEIVKNSALCPIVCKLRHSIQDAEDANPGYSRCRV